ncbi:hypothetical protein FOL46_003563, partial [Perkinsus olseni]
SSIEGCAKCLVVPYAWAKNLKLLDIDDPEKVRYSPTTLYTRVGMVNTHISGGYNSAKEHQHYHALTGALVDADYERIGDGNKDQWYLVGRPGFMANNKAVGDPRWVSHWSMLTSKGIGWSSAKIEDDYAFVMNIGHYTLTTDDYLSQLTKVEKVDTRWVDQKTPTSSNFKKNWSDDGNYGWSAGKKSWYETEDSSWYSDKGLGWYDQGWSLGKKNKSWSSHQNKQWSEEPAKSEVPKKVGNGSIEVESSKK